MDFSTRYAMYIEERADSILEGSDALRIKLAANAEKMLIAAIAVALLAFTYTFWSQLVGKMGVPRTIILLFFIYLCLCAQLYSIDVPLMLATCSSVWACMACWCWQCCPASSAASG